MQTLLYRYAGLQPTAAEMEACVTLITQQAASVQAGLCFLLTCPGLADSVWRDQIVEWLRNVLQHSRSRSYGEMLLLIGIHFHTHQLALIADLVRATLAMNVQLHSDRHVAGVEDRGLRLFSCILPKCHCSIERRGRRVRMSRARYFLVTAYTTIVSVC